MRNASPFYELMAIRLNGSPAETLPGIVEFNT
jgi:hypothetical protein